MPVNSGAVLRVLTGFAAALAAGLATRLAIAAALLATAAANRATAAAVLSRESMSESFQVGEQSGDPGVPVIGMAVLERPLVSGLSPGGLGCNVLCQGNAQIHCDTKRRAYWAIKQSFLTR